MTVNFSIGMVEVSGLGDAIRMLDEMCKVADVEFVATERKLGGRLVTIVVKGDVSAVTASVDAGEALARKFGSFKASQVIASPHKSILPFLHLEDGGIEVNSETAADHVGPLKEEKPKPSRRRTKKTEA
jgi:ethanolamine utilization protein EutM